MSETKIVETRDRVPLHCELWRPGDRPDGPAFAVCVVHGGAEHVSRYERLAGLWTRAGGLVFGADHRGQGRSGGDRGHVDDFTTYADDLRRVLEAVARDEPPQARPDAIPWFLFGHSMGGLITLTYLRHEHPERLPVRGAIVSAPLLALAMPVPWLKRLAAHVVGRLVPTLGFPTGIPAAAISRDPEQVARYEADKRRVGVVTPGWALAMERASAQLRAELAEITTPMLVYVGTGDQIVDHRATIEAFERIADPAARDQSLRIFEGYYHELHNEPAELRAPIEAMLVDWVTARLGPAPDRP